MAEVGERKRAANGDLWVSVVAEAAVGAVFK
jgi:hypothetical protein